MSSIPDQKYDADIPAGHAFEETRSFLTPRDRRLRKHGFKIHARPTSSPAIWERAGKLYQESEAHLICSQEEQNQKD